MKKAIAILMIALIAMTSVFANGAAETATEAKKTDTVRVAYMSNYASLCTLVSAMNTGAFEEQGITVELFEFADGPTIISAMESGSIDIGYIGHGAHKLCINGKADIFAFSHVGNGDAIVGSKAKGVTDVASLKGKKVGYASGTSSEQILLWALEGAGLTMNDIKGYEMDASALTTAMISGSLDACATWSPSSFTVIDALGSDAVVVANNLSFADRSASVASWIVMKKWSADNRDLLVRFTKALYAGMDYRADANNYKQVAEWVAKVTGTGFDTAYAQRGDAEWITSAELISQINDGTINKLYEVQKEGFGTAVNQDAKVSDYVLFDVMLEAAK